MRPCQHEEPRRVSVETVHGLERTISKREHDRDGGWVGRGPRRHAGHSRGLVDDHQVVVGDTTRRPSGGGGSLAEHDADGMALRSTPRPSEETEQRHPPAEDGGRWPAPATTGSVPTGYPATSSRCRSSRSHGSSASVCGAEQNPPRGRRVRPVRSRPAAASRHRRPPRPAPARRVDPRPATRKPPLPRCRRHRPARRRWAASSRATGPHGSRPECRRDSSGDGRSGRAGSRRRPSPPRPPSRRPPPPPRPARSEPRGTRSPQRPGIAARHDGQRRFGDVRGLQTHDRRGVHRPGERIPAIRGTALGGPIARHTRRAARPVWASPRPALPWRRSDSRTVCPGSMPARNPATAAGDGDSRPGGPSGAAIDSMVSPAATPAVAAGPPAAPRTHAPPTRPRPETAVMPSTARCHGGSGSASVALTVTWFGSPAPAPLDRHFNVVSRMQRHDAMAGVRDPRDGPAFDGHDPVAGPEAGPGRRGALAHRCDHRIPVDRIPRPIADAEDARPQRLAPLEPRQLRGADLRAAPRNRCRRRRVRCPASCRAVSAGSGRGCRSRGRRCRRAGRRSSPATPTRRSAPPLPQPRSTAERMPTATLGSAAPRPRPTAIVHCPGRGRRAAPARHRRSAAAARVFKSTRPRGRSRPSGVAPPARAVRQHDDRLRAVLRARRTTW